MEVTPGCSISRDQDMEGGGRLTVAKAANVHCGEDAPLRSGGDRPHSSGWLVGGCR